MGGRALLVWRLATRDLRRRAAESVMLLLVITAATTTLALGFALNGTSDNAWQITRTATAGPDIMAQTYPSYPDSLAQLTALAHADGVAASSGPYPMANPVLKFGEISDPVFAQGRDQTQPAVDRPYVTQGGWVRPGGVVIEQGFAGELNVRVGQTIELGGRPFQVDGFAVDTSRGANWRPQLVWVTRADATALASPTDKLAYVLNLRLSDPSGAAAFAGAHNVPSLFIATSGQIQGSDEKELTAIQIVLDVGTWLLSMLAISSVAVLVGGRMVEQTRRAGLLKAVGGTPGLVAVVLLAENLILALAATVLGLLVGELAAPALSSPGGSLLGSANSPSLTAPDALIVAGVAVAVAVMATGFPALRAARSSTIRVLNDPARPPRRRALLIALSARLPVPLLLGLRLAARRPRRVILTTLSLVITDVMIVCALALRSSFDRGAGGADLMVSQPGLGDPLLDHINNVVLLVALVLTGLAAVNAVFITQATVLDAQRPSALARTFGATPRQVSAGLTAAQLLPALFAGILSVPAGIGVFKLASAVAGGAPSASMPVWWMVAVVLGTLVVVGGLTLFPARAGARRPVAVVLRSE
jgi:putative ABC transport system permease protein